jgi:hypothetical protein
MLDGTATGPKTVEIGNWSGKAVFSPRGSLKKMLERSEFDNPGVYFLKSESESADFSDSVYIGEAEELRARMKQHIADRDFESVVCFLSKDELLTKAHIKYLESRLISIARAANASEVENATTPKLSRISEADVSDMEYFIEQIQLVLPAVGLQTLVPSIQPAHIKAAEGSHGQEWRIKSQTIEARMIESNDGFVVLRGSEASTTLYKSIAEGWRKIRSKLSDAGALVEQDGKLIFTEDTSFSSPSAAASVILGRQAPGPVSWIDENGKTYKEIQEQA